jgi:hypothetical protein
MFGQPSYLGVATADWVAALKSSDSLEQRLAARWRRLAAAQEAVPALTEALRDRSFVRVWGPLRWREWNRRTTPSPPGREDA